MVSEHGLGVHGVRVAYDDGPPAVADVDVTVAPGEILALLGPSGCGKSSLLRAVAGLVPLSAGSISWDGTDMAAVPVHRRGFGLMFQDGQLFPHRDVRGNIVYGLESERVPKAQRTARVAELLDLVGLAGYEDRPVTTLSGGQRQRVALARALAPAPRLLLLDEPLSSLDRSLREHLAGELAAIMRSAGATAVYVTHDHDEAFTVADRVAVMAAGQLRQVAAPAVLWGAPADAVVARFLGYGPLLLAEAGVTGVRTALGEWAWDVLPATGRPPVGSRLVVALGPEALTTDPDGPVRVPVVAHRFRRGHHEVDVVLPDGQHATARAAHPPRGDRAGLRVRPEHVALLTADDD